MVIWLKCNLQTPVYFSATALTGHKIKTLLLLVFRLSVFILVPVSSQETTQHASGDGAQDQVLRCFHTSGISFIKKHSHLPLNISLRITKPFWHRLISKQQESKSNGNTVGLQEQDGKPYSSTEQQHPQERSVHRLKDIWIRLNSFHRQTERKYFIVYILMQTS